MTGKSKFTQAIFVLAFIFIISLIFVKSSFAFTSRTGQNIVVSDTIINDSVFVSGNNIRIDSNVNGDIFCAGQTVEISGDVNGDVLCVAQNLVVNGKVDGDIRVAAQNINLNGEVTRNIMVVAQTLNSVIKADRDYFFAGQNVNIDNVVGRNLLGGGQSINLGAKIGGDANLYIENLTLKDSAKVSGNLMYESQNDASINKGASISGSVVKSIPPVSNTQKANYYHRQKTVGEYLADRLRSLIFALFVSLVLVYFCRNFITKLSDLMLGEVRESVLKGFLLLVFVPILTVLLAVTVIGIPFALILAMLYGLTIAFSYLFSSISLGVKVGRDFLHNEKSSNSIYINTVVGISLVWLLNSIPVVRWFTSLFVVVWGMGGIYLYFRKSRAPQAKNAK